MNLFHRLAIGGALSLSAASAAATDAVTSQPQTSNITFAPARSAEEPTVTACYWFDQQDDRYPLTPGVSQIDTGMLPTGFHSFHAQIMGDGVPTWIETSWFIKTLDLDAPTLKAYYWFDQQEERYPLTSGVSRIDTGSLPAGFHSFHAEITDNGVPTWIETSWFIKTFSLAPGQAYTTNIYIDDILHTTQTTPVGEDGMLSLTIDVNDLAIGVHLVMAQVISPECVPTALAKSAFVRVPTEMQLDNAKLYYLIDGIPAGEVKPTRTDEVYSLDIDLSSLPTGLHSISTFLAGADGFATTMETAWFVKTPDGGEGVKSYQYWLNDDPSTMREVVLDKVTNPSEIVTLLDMPLEPFCSRRYWFAIEDGKPAVYAQNDYQMLFSDAGGRFTMGSGRYTDMRVRQDVIPVGVIRDNTLTKVEGLGENEIRFYTFPGYAGDSISVSLEGEAMLEVYSPEGETLMTRRGGESDSDSLIRLTQEGVYYLAVHDISSYDNSVTIDFRHVTTHDPSLKAGDDFEYQGIIYTVIDAEAKTCKTKDGAYIEDPENPGSWIDVSGNTFEGDLIIPDKVSDGIDEYIVIEIGDRGFFNCDGITSLSLPASLITVGNLAFYDCEGIMSLDLPNSITTIGEFAFYNCDGIYTLDLPDSVTTIGEGAFGDCNNLVSLKLPENLANVGKGVFYYCTSLPSVELPASLTTVGENMFYQCFSLSSVLLPEALSKIDNGAFCACGNLKEIDLPEGVTTIERGAFEYAGLVNLDLPESVTYIGNHAFKDCSALTSVTLPASMQFIGDKAFENSNAIVTVNYAATTPIAAADNTFSGAVYDNATLEVPNATVADIQATVPWSLFRYAVANDGTISPGLSGGEEFEYQGIIYTVIDAEAKTCKTKAGSVTEIPGNPGVWIDVSSGNTFEGDLIIPAEVYYNSNEYTVIEIGDRGFFNCNGITSLSLPTTLTSIGEYAFYNCEGIYSLDLPDSVTTIENYAFSGCTYLISLKLPENLANVGKDVFSYCTSLPSVELPASLTTVSEEMFYQCVSLSSVVLPETLGKIDNGAFCGCGNLKEINLPEGVTTIERSAFESAGLVNLDLPESVTYIGNLSFKDCSALTSVTLPASMQFIGDKAFDSNNAIVTVNYAATTPIAAADNTFSRAVYDNATLEMANASLVDIQATVPWNLFGHAVANDGTVSPSLKAGDDFEYLGIVYTVVNAGAKTCKTKDGETGNSGNIFAGDLVIPQTVTDGKDQYTVTEIGSRGFYNCEGLTSVGLPASLQKMGNYAFANCDAIASVNYDAAQPIEAPDNVFSGVVYENATLEMPNATVAAIQATVPWSLFRYAVAKDGTIAPGLSGGEEFEYQGIIYTVIDAEARTCKTKEGGWIEDPDHPGESIHVAGNTIEGDLIIPAEVYYSSNEYIVIEIGKDGFYDCDGITLLSLPTTLISVGENGFGDCDGITSLYLPNSVTTIRPYGFSSCHNLVSLNLPDNLANVGEGAFRSCTSLESVTLPASLTTVGRGMFYDCGSLTSVQFPETVIKIDNDAFTYCGNLNEVILPDGLTSIGESAFYGCGGLVSLELPESLTYIGGSAFSGCNSLPSLILPDKLTNIGDEAFMYCERLTSVTLPASLQQMGSYAFANCDAIASVSYGATNPIEAPENVFSVAVYENATLEMPNATIAAIQVTMPWNLFSHTVAKDLNVGNEFEYRGIIYTVTDAIGKTCETKAGTEGNPGNVYAGELEIPQTVTDGQDEYTVTGIGGYGFGGSAYLTSVTLPASVETVGDEAFAGCVRLTSIVWMAQSRMPEGLTEAISNPNLLVYVTDRQHAPAGMNDNVVVMDTEGGTSECQSLVLQPGYPFGAVRAFDALHSSMTKEFTQTTPIGGCAGWETIVLPFNATSVRVPDARGELTPFALITDITTQYPYWLYEADSGSGWKEASGIMAGVPYIISMPNSEDYSARYRIEGPVTFSNPGRTVITPEVTSPYSVTWASGHRFRSLWQPLDPEEAVDAMGLNVGIDNLTDDEGHLLAPGSAFHVDVEPRPLEAYVTRAGGRRSLPVMGEHAYLPFMMADDGLIVKVKNGTLYVTSATDRRVEIFCTDGLCLGAYDVRSGETLKIEHLVKGMYIVAGNKVIIK